MCESSDDSTDSDEVVEVPNGSLHKIMKEFQSRHINDNNNTHIIIHENFIMKNLLEWCKNANDNDLLRNPSIGFVLEE